MLKTHCVKLLCFEITHLKDFTLSKHWFSIISVVLRRRQWQTTPVLLTGKSRGWRSLVAAVHGVAKSWTRLSDFTFTFHFHALERKWQPTPVFLPRESQEAGSLVDCRLPGRTKSERTEAT